MLPIGHPVYMPVFHRVKMDVIDVPLEISFIADSMLPVTTLPDSLLTFSDFAWQARPLFKAT